MAASVNFGTGDADHQARPLRLSSAALGLYIAPMQIPGLVDPKTVPRASTPARADGKQPLLGLSKAAMREALIAVGIPEKQARMRVSQVWNWIYHRGVTDIAAFANISKETRALLDAHFIVGRPEVVSAQVSTDGTRKWLLRFDDGEEAECVFIPDA